LVFGNTPHSNGTGSPQISQCPLGVSFPALTSLAYPKEPSGVTLSIGRVAFRLAIAASPSPHLIKFGMIRGPVRLSLFAFPEAHSSIICPNVSDH